MQIGVLKRLFAFTALIVVLAACAGGSPIQQYEGTSAYTQTSLWIDSNRHLTTNYSAGYLVPINTRVEILDSNRNAIVIRVPDLDRNVRIENAANHTGEDIAGIYDRYFGNSRVDLSRFDSNTRNAIEGGRVEEGMSRDAVLLARGYPPSHQTPSLDQNVWTYWRNRFVRQTVTFSGDRATELVGF
jgi:hypothetical protein